MTLNTEVYLNGPIGGKDAYRLAVAAIMAAGWRTPDTATVQHEEPKIIRDGVVCLRTKVGQGLPAWTWCYYRPDGPLNMEDVYDGPDRVDYRCTVNLSWNTGYAYMDSQGSCEDLHHRALRLLEASLPRRVTLRWVDEYMDEIHAGAPAASVAV